MRYATPAAVVLLACVAAGPATKPTTIPTIARDRLADAQSAIKAIEAKLQEQKQSRLAALRSTRDYQDASDESEKLFKELERARKTGTPAERVAASSAYGKAKARVERLEKDSKPTEAENQWAREKAKISADLPEFAKAARNESKIAEEWLALKAEVDAAPVLTSKQLELTGERYIGKMVKMKSAVFMEGTNDLVPYLPAQFLEQDDTWIGFAIRDAAGDLCLDLFAPKKTMADKVLSFRKGDKIKLVGYVFPLRVKGKYGIAVRDVRGNDD